MWWQAAEKWYFVTYYSLHGGFNPRMQNTNSLRKIKLVPESSTCLAVETDGKTPEPAARTQGSSWPLCVHLWGKTIDCSEVGTLSCRKSNKCLSSVCCLQEWCLTLRLLNRNHTTLAMRWGKGFVCVQSYIGILFCVLHSTSCTGVVVPYLRSWVQQ